jgi:hypothetical protein
VDLGYKVYPPLLGRGTRTPKKQWIRDCLEKRQTKRLSTVGDVKVLNILLKLAN